MMDQPQVNQPNPSRARLLLVLFLTMLKIGAFTFGGGYAMISLLQNEFVAKKKWIGEEEFLDLVAIAESTPGPIAINSSTYIGYRMCGFLGASVATVAMCIPSFVIIFVISLFFDRFLSLTVVANAFRGIQVAVVYLVLSAGVRMLRSVKKDPVGVVILSATLVLTVAFSIFAVSFSTVFYILIGGAVGLTVYAIRRAARKEGSGK